MHIPDGYLSPATSAAMYVAAAPFLYVASRSVRSPKDARRIPLVSLVSAASFVVMMFNLPLPGGTTGHAVGATLAAIVLGPWAAVLALSVTLAVQALFFGDGGILALGANISTMAIVMPLTGYAIWKFLRPLARGGAGRSGVVSALSAYISLNIGALATAVLLGIQAMLYRDASGRAMYFPYPVSVAVPVMMAGHLTVAGVAEAFLTGFATAWLFKTSPGLIGLEGHAVPAGRLAKIGFAAVGGMVLLTPFGLLAPGTAWGEWGRGELERLGLGYVPSGFDRFSGMWRAPFSGYRVVGISPSFAYVLSGILGSMVVITLFVGIPYLFTRIRHMHRRKEVA